MGNLLTSLLDSSSALDVYGREFSVIQNNIANANTPGYVKQDQSLVALPFNPSTGLAGGVGAGPLVSSRSEYLEQAIRNQQQSLGSAQQKAGDLSQIQSLFDPTSTSGVPNALDNLFGSFSQLSVNPNDGGARQSVIDAAGQVAQAFNQVATGIRSVGASLDNQTQDAVATINQIAGQVATINQTYRSDAQAGQDAGLDAQLHTALENLSQVANYSLIKTADGAYNVYLGGQTPLVIGAQPFAVSADFSGAQTVIRDAQGNDVTSQIDQGSLGALLQEKNVTLPGYTASLNAVAQNLADSVNTALSQGVDKNGNAPTVDLFTYDGNAGAAATLGVSSITPGEIAAALPSAPGGNGNAIAIAQIGAQPVVNGTFTLTQAYGNLGGQVGQDLANAKADQTSQQNLLLQTQNQRAVQTKVSLDEEATKLLQFQQAYQAVGKYITVLETLTQTLLAIVPTG